MLDNTFGIFTDIQNQTLDGARKSFLGKGVKYPVALDGQFQKDLQLVDDINVINQSLNVILNTKRGERFFLPEFGTDIHKHLFQPNVFVARDLIKDEILRCIKLWEKRITSISVTFAEEELESTASFIISYTIMSTGQLGEYLYIPENYISE